MQASACGTARALARPARPVQERGREPADNGSTAADTACRHPPARIQTRITRAEGAEMANREPQTSGQSSSKTKARRGGQNREAAQGAAERDDTYGLISAIYHSLKGADTGTQYIEDARRAGNEELATFFEEWRAEQNRRALIGRRLLADELADIEEEVDDLIDDNDQG
jgi:hypothetical protein